MADHDLSEQHIREHAYKLWQEAGSPEGGHEEFWHKAAAELNNQTNSEALPEPETTGDDIVEKAGGHYPPTGDTQNFA
jgi:hypothetical protein